MTLKRLALDIDHRWKPGDIIAVEGEFYPRSSLGIYTKKPVYRWRGRASWEFGSRFEHSRRFFLDDKSFKQAWYSDQGVFLVVEESTLERPSFLRNGTEIGSQGIHILLANPPALKEVAGK